MTEENKSNWKKDISCSISSYSSKEPSKESVEVPCWSCGKPVQIILPFYGCIYCRDCMTPKHFTIEGRGKTITPKKEENDASDEN